ETYDRNLDNIFQVQDEIARAIVDALKLPLLGQDEQAVAASSAASFEAYDLYLLGRHHYRQLNEQGFKKAVEYFTRAAAVDPDYAPAWSGLADAYLGLSDYGDLALSESYALAESAIERAVELAPNAPETLATQGILASYRGHAQEARALLERAVAGNPNDVNTLVNLASTLGPADLDRSVKYIEKAFELDPLSELTRGAIINARAYQGDFEAAIALAEGMLRDDPDNPGLHEAMANVYDLAGERHLAIPHWEKTWALRPGDVLPAMALSRNYRYIEDPASADAWLQKARQRGPDSRWTRLAELFMHFDQQNWESLNTLHEAMFSAGTMGPAIQTFYGDNLLRLGREADAERILRGVTDLFGDSLAPVETSEHANATKRLVHLLPTGEERRQRLEQLRAYVEVLLETRPKEDDTWRQSADLAMLEGDTQAALTNLEKSLEYGLVYRKSLEASPLYAGLRDDPGFRTVLALISEKARRQREQLEARGPGGEEAL
ncbi:MAG: tetratricopeptide repeat protein, partial [Xanthomonadales bacterium]|nr:tetratricopeptide repeat protein [Xanthomonadales bacterium]